MKGIFYKQNQTNFVISVMRYNNLIYVHIIQIYFRLQIDIRTNQLGEEWKKSSKQDICGFCSAGI